MAAETTPGATAPAAAPTAPAATTPRPSSAALRVRLTGSATRGLPLDVDVDVAPGHRLALIGSNGAGKTTVLRLLAGLDHAAAGSRVSSGTTVLADDGVHLRPGERRLPMTFAEPRLFPTMSVLDNLVFGAAPADRTRTAADAQAALEALGLRHLARRKAGELSSGQSAIVATLRTVFARSVGVLMDEPFSSLDTEIAAEVRSAVHGWLDSLPVPLVMATHSPLDVMALATHVGVLQDGVLVQHGPVSEVARRPTSQFAATFLGLNLFSAQAYGTTVLVEDPARSRSGVQSVRLLRVLPSGEDDSTVQLTTAVSAQGSVWVAFAPQALTLHPSRPVGSAQNTWATRIASVDQLGHSVRITCAGPLPVRADVTPGAAITLGLRPGAEVWVSLKATGIEVYPA